eukprot:14847168-Ditylum_brightwellii.AAC.1
MWYKKEYKSFKQLNAESTTTSTSPSSPSKYKFTEDHQGREYCYLTRRKHPVIPIIDVATVTDLSDMKSLDVLVDIPRDSGTLQHRERYAKTAMMLFYPFHQAEDLVENGTYWQTFVDVGGTKEYDEAFDVDDTLGLGLNP